MPKPKIPAAALDDPDLEMAPTYSTKSPSGATVPLMTQLEVSYYDDISARYQSDNKFTNVSDLLELDRVLMHELMCFRWGTWLLQGGVDYSGGPQANLEKTVQIYSKEIRELKASLGIDKKSRDVAKGSNPADFMHNLKLRAEEFGIHRDEQIIKAHTNWKELQGLITLYKNSNESERKIFNATIEDILEWLDEKFIEFDAIDEAFRVNQKIWIRDLND